MSFISWLKKIVSKQTSDAAKHQPDHQSLQEIEHPSVKLIYEQLNPSNKKEFPLLKPSHLNRYESQRINLGYTNLHHSSQKINLIKDVNYLWVYNAKKELILGIEEPWKYPQAFIDRQNTEQLNFFNSKILPQLKKAGILGHPTLACHFSAQGSALPKEGQAFIAGELGYREGKWVLNNNSGRYSQYSKEDPKQIKFYMDEVAKQFIRHSTEKEIKIELTYSGSYAAYAKQWHADRSPVENALVLLKDYAKSNWLELFFTAHWNRHHVHLVRDALTYFSKNPPQNIDEIIHHLVKQLASIGHDKINLHGSLMRRLKFLSTQVENDLIREEPNASLLI
ncbi:DUF5617 domain-containing protein [Legionella sp. 27cVA30]|uniref:DUF5617 domain-containing protein n=1 Tax=Legionella sp. 27cVA30 TaxID=2905657 RepID=UPI00209CD6E4|nr:DUF5617 domain-containing protein [Legionella sp. 27cVA30]MCP0913036.1 DUF5617 domain-containing protein [Legionella sp. 27cVA30]